MKKLFLILAAAVALSICIFILPHSCNAKAYEKKITPEYENGALVFEKARHGMIKTLGTNFCTRKSLSIYIEIFDEKVANGKTPYRIFSTAENEIYLTNSRNLFFNELLRIATETNESRVYVLHHCSSASTFNVLPKEIEASGLFSECEYRKMPPETDGGEWNYSYTAKETASGNRIEFIKDLYCTCGSDSWKGFEDDRKIRNRIKLIFDEFYY